MLEEQLVKTYGSQLRQVNLVRLRTTVEGTAAQDAGQQYRGD